MNKHPAAHDPMLQDKIDMICQSPEEWSLRYQIDKMKDSMEHNIRMIRALEKEVKRSESCLNAMELALINIQDMKKQMEDR